MKLNDFDFYLPQELIAQHPTDLRDRSNLLISSGKDKSIVKFYVLLNYLHAGDLLVFNNSRVINAKFNLQKENSGSVNINLNRPLSGNPSEHIWLGFARPAKKIRQGDVFYFGDHKVVIKDKLEYGEVVIEFRLGNNLPLFDFLDEYGCMPLPQYIKRPNNEKADLERYQNIYSRPKGSVAAATAGLHFTEELLGKIKAKDIDTAFVTLHVGAGTFLPVRTENIEEHKMHSEYFEMTQETADKINAAKREGRRVIAVGTTTIRTIEACTHDGIVVPASKETDIFITPGYKFQIPDMLITNFHLPKSTLFMLVCAFAGTNKIKDLYKYAIENKMRFFSYGDAMLIEKNS